MNLNIIAGTHIYTDIYTGTVWSSIPQRRAILLIVAGVTSHVLYVSYIQDILALCRKTDKDMWEAAKVSHILKGVAVDALSW